MNKVNYEKLTKYKLFGLNFFTKKEEYTEIHINDMTQTIFIPKDYYNKEFKDI